MVKRTNQNGRRNSLKNRTKRLLETDITFIYSKSFPEKETASIIDAEGKHLFCEPIDVPTSNELPAHLARLCAEKLLSADDETKLFRRFNFRKYQADTLRSKLDPEKPDRKILRQVEQYLGYADQARERLILSNVRLVVSIARKFVNTSETFDELLSDGIVSLTQAVEKFDFERGYRFSTYAYRAIMRHLYRVVMSREKDRRRLSTGADAALLDHVDEIRPTPRKISAWISLENQLKRLVRKLDDRERFIIQSRFALRDIPKAQTFQSLADQMGLSKERVRQLEQRAIRKLREMADSRRIRELLDSSGWDQINDTPS